MSRRELVSVLVKVMGLYFLIRIVAGAPLTVLGTAISAERAALLSELYRVSFIVGVALLGAVLCVSLIRNSDAVARWVCPEDPEPKELGGMAFADWQTLGYNLVGLVLMVGALPALVSVVVTYKAMQHYDADMSTMALIGKSPLSDVASIATRLLLGLFLFLSPRGLTRLWARIREARHFEDDRREEA